MHGAVQIHRSESAGRLVPEPFRPVLPNLCGMLAKIGRIEHVRSLWHRPLRVPADRLLHFSHVENGVVVVNRCERIFSTKRQQIPVIAADPLSWPNRLLSVDDKHPGPPFMAGPRSVNALFL